jgi:hypothetical protein
MTPKSMNRAHAYLERAGAPVLEPKSRDSAMGTERPGYSFPAVDLITLLSSVERSQPAVWIV